MKDQIKELRIKIDGLSSLVKELKPITECNCGVCPSINSKEIEKAYDSLILAKAWLGKVLQELGEETPYKNDGNRKTVDDIEPTADKYIAKVGFTKENKDSTGYLNYLQDNTTIDKNKLWDKKSNNGNLVEKSHIEKVDWLRQELKKLYDRVMNPNFHTITFGSDEMGDLYWSNFYTHLSEARFWLGFELARCREEETKTT